MCLSEYEISLIQSFYNYNRIPLWIYNKQMKLQYSFFSENLPGLTKKLSSHMDQLVTKCRNSNFDILYYDSELYYIFSFERNQETFYCLGGPMLLSNISASTTMLPFSFSHNMNSQEIDTLIKILPVISFPTFCAFLRIIMLTLKKTSLSLDEINTYQLSNLQDSLKFTFINELFENREDFRIHSSYSEELSILSCVKEGNVSQLRATYKALPQFKYGNMSNNPLRLLFYGCIANTTLVSRYAIEGGLNEETAFTLGDVYIRQMENCKTAYELNVSNENMVVDFTEQVAKAKTSNKPAYTEAISSCIDYIVKNIHEKITLDTLAGEVYLTPKYLSHLFRRETGQTLSSFISNQKIEEAKNLLSYSHYTYSQISNSLSFHSQSYFIAIFKKKVGITPRNYRSVYSKSTQKDKCNVSK